MKTTEILELQAKHPGCILFVRDRIFWQCWEESAWIFVQFVRKYRVHVRHFKNLSMDLAWLGFPENTLEGILKILLPRNCAVLERTEKYALVSHPWSTEGYTLWKNMQVSLAQAQQKRQETLQQAVHFGEPVAAENPDASDTAAQFIPIYRTAYDLTLEIYRISSRFSKDYKFSLGERLRNSMTGTLLLVHQTANHFQNARDASRSIFADISESRLYLRMLKDLHQIGMDRFAQVNLGLESISSQVHAGTASR